MRLLRATLFALLGAAFLAPVAAANPYEDKAEARLLQGWIQPDGTRMAALHIRLAPGWKTYWRAPGDAGIPPQFDWSGANNIASARLHWPRPIVFDQGGMRSIGYERELILPMTLTPKRTGKLMAVDATVDIGICKDICVPMRIELEETLAPDARADVRAIKTALARAPESGSAAGVTGISCTASSGRDGLIVEMQMTAPPLGGREEAAIETGDPLIWAKEPVLTRSGNRLTLRSELVHAVADSFALDRSALRVTLLGANRAIDIQGC